MVDQRPPLQALRLWFAWRMHNWRPRGWRYHPAETFEVLLPLSSACPHATSHTERMAALAPGMRGWPISAAGVAWSVEGWLPALHEPRCGSEESVEGSGFWDQTRFVSPARTRPAARRQWSCC